MFNNADKMLKKLGFEKLMQKAHMACIIAEKIKNIITIKD